MPITPIGTRFWLILIPFLGVQFLISAPIGSSKRIILCNPSIILFILDSSRNSLSSKAPLILFFFAKSISMEFAFKISFLFLLICLAIDFRARFFVSELA